MEKCTIPVVFEGHVRCVKNVTRYATCRDVIHKLLADLHRTSQPDDFSMYEVTGGLERAISDKDRIMKVLRSWGAERANFQFVMKSRENKRCQRSASSASGRLDELDNTLTAGDVDSPPDVNLSSHLITSVTTAYLDQRSLEKNVNENQTLGKLSVLRRFFTDLPVQGTTRQKTSLPVTLRGRGACADVAKPDFGCDAADISEDRTLDLAFVNSYKDVFIDEGVDVESLTSVDLNTAFIGNIADVIKSEDTLNRDVYPCTEMETVSEVSNGDFVRKLFDFGGKTCVTSQDAELESFMNTRIYDTDTDEGVFSSGSDVIVVRKETSV